MIGKKIKINDYKFTYGQETVMLNIYGAFKNTKSGNKYVVYSYENNNKKLYYGTFFKRKNEALIMTSKENPKEIVQEFLESILKEEKNEKFEIISLDEIETAEIIDEFTLDFDVDIKKLADLTIPKPVVQEPSQESNEKKPISIAAIFFGLFVIVVITFFFVNPEVILGKNKYYTCTTTYLHENLPAYVNKELFLTFDGKGKITDIEVTTDYVFNDTNYYQEFKEKSYYYQYMEENDTYKLIDENYTYRLFSEIDTTIDFFLPTEESELISHYKENNYTCKEVEVDE